MIAIILAPLFSAVSRAAVAARKRGHPLHHVFYRPHLSKRVRRRERGKSKRRSR